MKRLNDILIIIELAFIVAPITFLLAIVGLSTSTTQLTATVNLENIFIFTLVILSLFATISVWALVIGYLKNKTILRKPYLSAWCWVLVGLAIVLLAYFSHNISNPVPYSDEWWFYDQLQSFTLGIPLILPVLHTLFSALINRTDNNIHQSISKSPRHN